VKIVPRAAACVTSSLDVVVLVEVPLFMEVIPLSLTVLVIEVVVVVATSGEEASSSSFLFILDKNTSNCVKCRITFRKDQFIYS
jgi:hypothetical protein